MMPDRVSGPSYVWSCKKCGLDRRHQYVNVRRNWNNGALTNVNFVFDGSKVANFPVSRLKSSVDAAVAGNFKQKPMNLMISVAWSQ